jgi:ribosomal protein S18 acetylase RimI-like enzyme
MTDDVRLIDDDKALAVLLEIDPFNAAYALCDLDPPYRENATFVGACRDEKLETVMLLYSLPTTTALHVYGDVDGAVRIFDRYRDLPQNAFLILSPEYVPAVQTRYAPRANWHVLRMVLETADLTIPSKGSYPVARLTIGDAPAIFDLYSLWGRDIFETTMLLSGEYCGVFDGAALVAIAGTHTASRRRGIAAIGGVFTHPDYRGRGLATAVTGDVSRILTADGVTLIVLNVVEDNAPAISAYERLGFRRYRRLYEGPAGLRKP